MIDKFLTAWTSWVVKNALLTLCLMGLIRQNTDWKQVHNNYLETFPQYDQNTLVVLSGNKPNALLKVTRALSEDIATHQDVFSLVFAPAASDFADRHALLYLDTETLNDTISRLAEAQPFLTAVAGHDNLQGVLNLLLDAVTVDEELPSGLSQIADAFELAIDSSRGDDTGTISWRDELFRPEDRTYYQLIFIKGKQEFGKDLPNGLVIGRLEAVIAEFEHPYMSDVQIRLTGQVPLEHQEIVSAWESVSFAGTLALVILVLVLLFGVRSIRIIAATYISMICGLIWTSAWAMFTVGSYNTISVMFLVMFIGLGVDFAIHLCMKYQESLGENSKSDALIDANQKLGPALMLCGITSGIGFLAFVPTEYIGLRELGIISGGGMIIAVVVSLTLIPAMFAIMKPPAAAAEIPLVSAISALAAVNPRQTSIATFVLAGLLIAIASKAQFDYSTLSLKDPDSEAMATLRELHDEDIVTDYVLTWVAPDIESAEAQRDSLTALEVVSEVVTPNDYLPADQQEKLYLLEDATFLLDSVFYAEQTASTLTDPELLSLISQLQKAITEEVARPKTTPDVAASLNRIHASLALLAGGDAGLRHRFTQLIIPPVQEEIFWLSNAFSATEVAIEQLPGQLRERIIAPDGSVIVSITPGEDVVDVSALRRFTEEVRSIVSNVTGRPVLDLGIGEIVIEAFTIALTLAIVSIFVILLVALRSPVDALLVFIPLTMTALVTLSASVVSGMQLNMANIVVIPLIFGLGVDNGIHIVKRFHQVADVTKLVQSSTPRAVFLSNLTSLSTFCALSVSTHHGIYSIGVLLTVGLASLMLLTLIALPALLATFSKPRHLNLQTA